MSNQEVSSLYKLLKLIEMDGDAGEILRAVTGKASDVLGLTLIAPGTETNPLFGQPPIRVPGQLPIKPPPKTAPPNPAAKEGLSTALPAVGIALADLCNPVVDERKAAADMVSAKGAVK
jgi:hypothetical protein